MSRNVRACVVCVALIGGTGGLGGQQPRSAAPDLILTDGKIFTSDSLHPWAQALAIRGQRIVAVGTTADVARLAGGGTRKVSLHGRVVVAGFNDAHDHFGNAEFGVPFVSGTGPVPDPLLAGVLDSVRAVAARTQAGRWIHSTVGPRIFEDPGLGRAALDRAAPNNPVMLLSWTGHGIALNTAGLRALGISEDVRNVVGGRYERDAAGHLTGIVQEYAQWVALRRLYSGLPRATIVAALRAYAAEDLRFGITSVQDMNGYLDPATTVAAFHAADLPIRVRVIPYPMTDSHGLLGAEWYGVNAHPAARTVVSGVKWILDGTPFERGAFMRAEYADRAGWHGGLEFPVDTIRKMLVRALATREPLHLHVSGDSTPRLVVALMRQLAPDSMWRPLRVRFEHGDGVAGDLLPAVRSLGIVIVQNPTHFDLGESVRTGRFGRDHPWLMAVRSIVAAGIPLAIGSDGPRNPFLNMMFAITNPNNPTQALTREQFVTAYTRGSAYAESAEHDKGTLAPGMLADLAVLSQDIFTVRVNTLPETVSVMTIVGGRIVYEK